jgi:hypothetical protein
MALVPLSGLCRGCAIKSSEASENHLGLMKNVALKPGYERVFTVTEYFDGPRKGNANYHGRPHFYECVFDEANDNYSDLFQLTPVDTEIFELAMEDWGIWRRWEIAFHTGKADIATRPALPHETKRHLELKNTFAEVSGDQHKQSCRSCSPIRGARQVESPEERAEALAG